MRHLILAVLISLSTPACAADLVISSNLRIDYQPPATLSHSQRLLIFKYNDWHFSHEILDPTEIYPSVDLTGMEQLYVRSMFAPQHRQDLPEWLAVLSKEQAEAFSISKENSIHNSQDEWELYAAHTGDDGNIFIIEEAQIHHLSVRGNKKHFTQLIESIEER